MDKIIEKENSPKEILTSEEYKSLVDECISLISEMKFDLGYRNLEWRWELGKEICGSNLYVKYGDKGWFLEKLSKDLSISKPFLYQCIKFYQVYKADSFEEIKFLNQKKRLPTWVEIRKTLYDEKKCPHDETYLEIIQINRTKCKKCDKTLNEEKSKTIKS